MEGKLKLSELLALQPPVRRIPDARTQIRKSLVSSGKRLVVIDDDPTGAQTIHGVRVFMNWSVEVLRQAFSSEEPVFFICDNSRSLGPAEAQALSLEVGHNLREAIRQEGAEFLLASRSDSTLRGHFPVEVDALTAGLGLKPDGTIIIPAFFEAGRYTIDDIHYAEQDGELVPVHRTEFARDPVVGFKNSNLKAWVSEKMNYTMAAKDVRSIPLRLLREGGPEAVAEGLLGASEGVPIVVNATCYEDLEVLVSGLQSAENKGKKFVYRCAASFIKARGGFEDRPMMTNQELAAGAGPGLIVVGSHVEKTSRQLKQLLDSGLAAGIELKVQEVIREEARENEIRSISREVDRRLEAGEGVVLYTSRELQLASNGNVLETGNTIMQSLCEVIRRIESRPGYIVAKGGITSIELARTALNVKVALVPGQIVSGVPVWRTGAEARWPDIPYVIFPGNVGDDSALLKVVTILNGR
jgi:uncharacterized protein YgbK (DUF1537 family)